MLRYINNICTVWKILVTDCNEKNLRQQS